MSHGKHRNHGNHALRSVVPIIRSIVPQELVYKRHTPSGWLSWFNGFIGLFCKKIFVWFWKDLYDFCPQGTPSHKPRRDFHVRSIRSIVPQELVYKRHIPSGWLSWLNGFMGFMDFRQKWRKITKKGVGKIGIIYEDTIPQIVYEKCRGLVKCSWLYVQEQEIYVFEVLWGVSSRLLPISHVHLFPLFHLQQACNPSQKGTSWNPRVRCWIILQYSCQDGDRIFAESVLTKNSL